MDKTLEVLKRITTKVGEPWPLESWVYVQHFKGKGRWILVDESNYMRWASDLSECEANHLGIFRKVDNENEKTG